MMAMVDLAQFVSDYLQLDVEDRTGEELMAEIVECLQDRGAYVPGMESEIRYYLGLAPE